MLHGPSALKSTNIMSVCVGSQAESWEFTDAMCFFVMRAGTYFLGIYFLNNGLPLVWIVQSQTVCMDVRVDRPPPHLTPINLICQILLIRLMITQSQVGYSAFTELLVAQLNTEVTVLPK